MGESLAGMKPYRVEYVQLIGWENDLVGLWLAENDEWLLLRHVPIDYVVDGYLLIAKQHIATRDSKKKQKQVEQILKLKGIKAEVPPRFVFGDVVDMFRWVEQHFGIAEFADEEESVFLGWLDRADAVHFWINSLDPDGTVTPSDEDEQPFVLSELRYISFDTDYINSMKLLWQHKSRQVLLKPSDN